MADIVSTYDALRMRPLKKTMPALPEHALPGD
jgi:hypothetical protein